MPVVYVPRRTICFKEVTHSCYPVTCPMNLVHTATSYSLRHTKEMARGTFSTSSEGIQDQTICFTRRVLHAVKENLLSYTLVRKCEMTIHMQTNGADKHTTRRRAPKKLFGPFISFKRLCAASLRVRLLRLHNAVGQQVLGLR